jgi:hypothetical protein
MDVLWEPVFYVLLGLVVVLVRLSEWWFGWDFEEWINRWLRIEKQDENTRQAAAREDEARGRCGATLFHIPR